MPPNERWFGLNPFNPEEAFKTSISFEEEDENEHGGGLGEDLKKTTKVTEQWNSILQLAKTIRPKIDYATLMKYAKTYESTNPEWFRDRGRIHPELVLKLKEFASQRVRAPEGWETYWSLASKMGVAHATIKEIASIYTSTKPEWLKVYYTRLGSAATYLHPELAKIISHEIHSRNTPPSGWETPGGIEVRLKSYGRVRSTILKIAESYRADHPDWFKKYYSRYHGREIEYMAPPLVKVIEEELPRIKTKEATGVPKDGWQSTVFAKKLGVTRSYVSKLAEKYRGEHPDWFEEFYYRPGREAVYFHPELLELIRKEVDAQRERRPPMGWFTASALAERYGVVDSTIKRITDRYRLTKPGWYAEYVLPNTYLMAEHYHPELVALIKEDIKKREGAPSGWESTHSLAGSNGVTYQTIERMVEKYRLEHPKWFVAYRNFAGGMSEYLHPDLVSLIDGEIKNRHFAPKGWLTLYELSKITGTNYYPVQVIANTYRQTKPEWFKNLLDRNTKSVREHFSPELVDTIKRELGSRELPPAGWMTKTSVSKQNNIDLRSITSFIEESVKLHPAWVRVYLGPHGQMREHLHPELVEAIKAALGPRSVSAPEGWKTNFRVVRILREEGLAVSFHRVENIANKYRSAHPEWFHLYRDAANKTNEFYSSELVDLIKDEIRKNGENKVELSRKENTREHFQSFVEEVSEGETDISKYFRSLLNAFGASRCVDILYKFRPEYRAIHPEDVKGTIAEYLGDYLVAKRPFTADDAENAIEHLSDLTLREGLVQTMKEDCYRFVVAALRHRNGRDSKALVEAYRDHVREKIGHLAHPVFAEVVDEVINYYQDLWVTYERPENVVGSLSEQREFPDINQRMNMKELAEKKRLLIADEMGLGKSASAILAKEKLGIKSALVVAPSNVIQTWKRYLSEESEGGYFKQGSAPRVCVLESPQQLENLQQGAFDYYLLSHERLNPRYVRKVKGLNPDMLIVDEVHKLKELKGSRSQQLVELSEGVGEDGHVALLSGTPVPNKIEDIAVTLRVLYPDRFRNTTDRELVSSIIYGDLVDLRALLVPRMQMKGLEESLDMPELHEEEREIELSELEKEVYEILLEDDELFPNEKIKILRQFLLNPHLVDSTPGITGCKVEALSESLNSAFKESDKIVVFVNDYIEGVIRGEGNIIQELGIPQDVEVKVIHQHIPKVERVAIERSLKASGGKLLLLVSGQTADVGVDYSAADRIFFYNEPWTEYQKRQELGRVYRPGLAHDLESDTFIAKGTIEDGMHQYIERKYLAVEKLLRGIPVTDLEKSLLGQDERSSEPDLSVNPELAEYYFSSWDKLMKIFGYVKEIGERNFRQFLEKYGGDYAEAYRVLGNRSYQSNANRVTATVLEKIAEKSGQDPASIRILDIASGPEMLKRHIGKTYQEQVTSMDMNPEHFKDLTGKNNVVGSWLDMPFPEKTFDYLNLCLSLHYTNFAPSKGMYERLQVFQEMNRVLKVGGKAVLNLIYSYPPKDFQKFKDAIHELGFSIVEDYTGEASSGDRYHSHLVTLEKIKDLDPSISAEELSDLLGKERRDGLKFRETKEKLRRSRQVITKLALNGKEIDLKLNAKDREVLDEEQKLLAEAEALKKKHGSIHRIPAPEIIGHGFVRVLSGSKYVLFKKLEKGSGAVVIRE